MAAVVAVLDTSAPSAAAQNSPACSPFQRTTTNPANDTTDTSTTTVQILSGFNACQGP